MSTMMAGGGAGAGGSIARMQAGGIPANIVIDGNSSGLTPQELRRLQIRPKLHPAIAALIERLRDPGKKPGAGESKFVRNGKAEIQIWLSEKSAAVLADLKKLGFELILDPKSANTLIGRLPIANLAALSQLEAVRYVAPLQ